MVEIEVGVALPTSHPKTPMSFYMSRMETEQVRAAIQELPVEFREIILLREYEDLSYLEVASVLDCLVGAVMSRSGRERAKLRTLFSEKLKVSDSSSVRGAK